MPTAIDNFTGANQLFDIPDDLKSVVSEHWAQFPPQESTFYSLNQCNGQMPPPYVHQFVWLDATLIFVKLKGTEPIRIKYVN